MNYMKKKYTPVILLAIGVAVLLSAILLIIFGVGRSTGVTKVMFIIMSLLLLLIGGLCVYLTLLVKDEDRNYFLYDRTTEHNMDIKDLTFDHVNKRMSKYMQSISQSYQQMWNENIIGSDNELFGENNLFKPLVAYKMLYDLYAVGNDELWGLFTYSDKAIIKSLSDVLATNGDAEMGNTLMYFRDKCPDDYSDPTATDAEALDDVRKFISGNIKYIQSNMLKYVKANINKFV